MGEYATYRGESIKIGTCESMYYLRADQARLVTAEPHSVDPIRDAGAIRFRFPFPDEDSILPGAFEDYGRGLRLPGMRAPESLAGEHYSVQLTNREKGYVCSIPCPESVQDAPSGLGAIRIAEGIHVHRNGFAGATFLVQQRLIDGQLWPILQCTCGMAWRVALADCGPICDAIEYEHKRYVESYVNADEAPATSFYTEIAARIRFGFDRDYVASLGL